MAGLAVGGWGLAARGVDLAADGVDLAAGGVDRSADGPALEGVSVVGSVTSTSAKWAAARNGTARSACYAARTANIKRASH